MTIIDNKAIGYRMRQERETLELSRERFAERIGLSDYYVGQLERGERQMSLPSLVRIADSLRISLDYLVLGTVDCHAEYVGDPRNTYGPANEQLNEILILFEKCSMRERALLVKLMKEIFTHLSES